MSAPDSTNTLKRKRLLHDDYTVAIIVPLAVELAPLRAMLEAVHEDLLPTRVFNSYTLGQIGEHNVVIAPLPSTGTNDSGAVANQLLNDFPNVQFGFLVGVGGGLPDVVGNIDIRLGDVVVSEVAGANGAVVQLDRQKVHDGAGDELEFESTGHLNKPHPLLASAVKKLKAQHQNEGHTISKLIADALRRYPSFGKDHVAPNEATDQLFRATYRHNGGPDCSQCDSNELVERHTRTGSSPYIHHGPIGSSNSLIRSAIERDRLRQKFKILSVEMEAAGLMDVLPCLVVRGICDYADSHKNKQWQPYAALTAAAYVKELLLSMPNTQPRRSRTYPGVEGGLTHMDNVTRKVSQNDTDNQGSVLNALLAALRYDRMNTRLDNIADAHPRTCKWLFETDVWSSWINQNDLQSNYGILWMKGKPGSGKSTVMRTALNWIQSNCDDEHILSYFFNARANSELEKSSKGLYRSLTYQLLQTFSHLKPVFLRRFSAKYHEIAKEDFSINSERWRVDDWTEIELKNFLLGSVKDMKNHSCNIFIDALDEAEESDVRSLVDFLEDLALSAVEHKSTLRICLSSRHYPQIGIRRALSLVVEDQPGHQDDILRYIEAKLYGDPGQELMTIRNMVFQKSSMVFLWVVLVIPRLRRAYDRGRNAEMLHCVNDLPPELNTLYHSIMLPQDGFLHCYMLLQLVLCAFRPLRLAELYLLLEHLLNERPSLPPSLNINGDDLPSEEVLQRYINDTSRGLVEVTQSQPVTVQFVHESVRTYLAKDGHRASVEYDSICHHNMKAALFEYMIYRKPIFEHALFESSKGDLSDFILLPYAVHYLFKHAEFASERGIAQKDFLAEADMSGIMTLWQPDFYFLFNLENVRLPNRYKYLPTFIGLFSYLVDTGHTNLLRDGLSCEAICEAQSEGYGSYLQLACFLKDVKIVRTLLDAGETLGGRAEDYNRALVAAFSGRSEPIIEALLEKGADLKSIFTLKGDDMQFLANGNMGAARKCPGDVSAMLYKYCSSLDLKDEIDDAMQEAQAEDVVELVEFLKEMQIAQSTKTDTTPGAAVGVDHRSRSDGM